MSGKYKRDSYSKALILADFEKLNEYTEKQNQKKEIEELKTELNSMKKELQEIRKFITQKYE